MERLGVARQGPRQSDWMGLPRPGEMAEWELGELGEGEGEGRGNTAPIIRIWIRALPPSIRDGDYPANLKPHTKGIMIIWASRDSEAQRRTAFSVHSLLLLQDG